MIKKLVRKPIIIPFDTRLATISMNDETSRINKILANSIRQEILELINKRGKISYVDIRKELGRMDTGKLNYHLKILGDLISKDLANGKYALTDKGIAALKMSVVQNGKQSDDSNPVTVVTSAIPGSSKSLISARRIHQLLAVFTVLIVAVVITSGVVIYETQLHGIAKQSTGSLPSEPLPSIWQENFSATPSSIETTANGVMYFLVDNNDTWTNSVVSWDLIAVELSNGNIIWHHNVTLASNNILPELYICNEILYLISDGGYLSLDGASVKDSAGIIVVSFNETNGQIGVVRSISATGVFATKGSLLYASWVTQDALAVKTVAYSVFTNNSSSALIWQVSLAAPYKYLTNIAYVSVNDMIVLLPLWNLTGLNPATGQLLFSIPYYAFNVDSINVIDGALVNSKLYYVNEWGIPGSAMSFNLVGIDLLNFNTILNVTVASSKAGMSPLPVEQEGNDLVVHTDLGGNFVVTTLAGSILWSSEEIKYASPSGIYDISPGDPAAVLDNGNWVLTSVTYPTGKSNNTIQYFEQVNPSNGSLVWIHQFSFPENSSNLQFYPPNGMGAPSVVIIGASSSYLVYRWRDSVGCTAI